MQINSDGSSSYTNSAYSSNGISGMNSGIDTEALVKSMLSGIQTKIDKQEQSQKVLEMQQEEYREVIDEINEFKDKYFSSTGEKSLVLSSTFNSTTTESNNSSAVKAVATADAVEGSFDIEVKQLASEARMTGSVSASSANSIKVGDSITSDKNKKTMTVSVGNDPKKTVEIDISGVVSNEDLIDKINSKCSGIGVTASLDSDGKIVYSGSGKDTSVTVTDSKGNTESLASEVKQASVSAGKIDTSKIGADKDDGSTPTATYNFKINDVEFSVTLARGADKNAVESAFNSAVSTVSEGENAGKTLSSLGVKATVDDDGNLKFEANGAGGADSIKFETVAADSNTGTSSMATDFKSSNSSSTRTFKAVSSTKSEVNTIGKMTVSYNGVSKDLTITDTETSESLSQKLYDAFGKGVKLNSDGTITAGTGKNVSVSGSDDVLKAVGMMDENGKMVSSKSNQISTSQTLSEIYGDNGGKNYEFSVNGVNFSFSSDTKLSDMMTEINGSRAGVTMTYNSLNDKFSITGLEKGEDSVIDVKDSDGGLMRSMFGDAIDSVSKGSDAVVLIDGEEIKYADNDLSYNGVNLTLKKVTNGDTVNIETTKDTDKALDAIVSFVEDYNKLIEDLNGRTHAKAEYKNYAPLTDAQKDEMSDSEIEKWEEKSKTGLLSGDNDIQKFLDEMRSVLYTKVGDSKLLSDIGIESSKDWKDYGKLTIDKGKLTDALNSDPKGVSDIFTGKNGICSRLNNACKKVANTSSGSPGTLVSLAGIKGKATEKNNTINKRLDSIKDVIEKLKAQYDSRKERLWKQFNSMESALGSMNSTYNYLSSMMGGGY